MAEELQSLLEKIQKDGIDRAETEAKSIVGNAQAKAAALIKDAEARAARIVEDANKESKALIERGGKSLEQAARDVVLSVRDAISRMFAGVVRHNVARVLDRETLARLLVDAVKAYMAGAAKGTRLDVLLPQAQADELARHLLGSLSEELRKGVDVRGDDRVLTGFHIRVTKEEVVHDFSEAAITTAICELLRPNLAEVVRNAMDPKK